jgi:succinoglycan biosynthesis protein ExoM
MTVMRVSVCICTYKRSFVTETIGSILAQKSIPLSDIEIIVCDDDPQGSAKELVTVFVNTGPVRTRYILSGSQNVAICRNTCLLVAQGDWIAFIDDDEIAEPNWLTELLSAQAQFAAEVVKGFVKAIYPATTPRWIRAGDPFTRDYGPTGSPASNLGTGNVLFSRSFAVSRGLTFNPRFGQTGSEDSDFFRRFHRLGARIISSQSAIVNEIVPESRVQPSSLAHRFRRQGRTHGSAFISKGMNITRLTAIGKAVIVVAVCATYPLTKWLPQIDVFRFRLFRSFWYHLGLLEGIAGRQPMSFET